MGLLKSKTLSSSFKAEYWKYEFGAQDGKGDNFNSAKGTMLLYVDKAASDAGKASLDSFSLQGEDVRDDEITVESLELKAGETLQSARAKAFYIKLKELAALEAEKADKDKNAELAFFSDSVDA